MLEHLIFRLFHYLTFAGTLSFFGIGMGPSGEEKKQYGEIASLADFSTSQGERDTLASDNFWQSILKGDPGEISKVLGPELSGINKRGQQAKKTASEFGNRGGGTNAGMQMEGDRTRSEVDSITSDLTGKAAGALGASGQGLLAAGVSAHEGAFSAADTIQQQHSAQMNDLFKSIASVAAAPFTGGASLGLGEFSKPGGGGKPAFPGESAGSISADFGGPSSADTTTSDLSWLN